MSKSTGRMLLRLRKRKVLQEMGEQPLQLTSLACQQPRKLQTGSIQWGSDHSNFHVYDHDNT